MQTLNLCTLYFRMQEPDYALTLYCERKKSLDRLGKTKAYAESVTFLDICALLSVGQDENARDLIERTKDKYPMIKEAFDKAHEDVEI